jgi:hypothetical protein
MLIGIDEMGRTSSMNNAKTIIAASFISSILTVCLMEGLQSRVALGQQNNQPAVPSPVGRYQFFRDTDRASGTVLDTTTGALYRLDSPHSNTPPTPWVLQGSPADAK